MNTKNLKDKPQAETSECEQQNSWFCRGLERQTKTKMHGILLIEEVDKGTRLLEYHSVRICSLEYSLSFLRLLPINLKDG